MSSVFVFGSLLTTQHIKQQHTTATHNSNTTATTTTKKPTMTPAIPDRPDRPAFTSQRAYPHLSLLRTTIAAVVLAALLFRPSNSNV